MLTTNIYHRIIDIYNMVVILVKIKRLFFIDVIIIVLLHSILTFASSINMDEKINDICWSYYGRCVMAIKKDGTLWAQCH